MRPIKRTSRFSVIGDSITFGDFSNSASWLDGFGPLLRAHFARSPTTYDLTQRRITQRWPIMVGPSGAAGFTWINWQTALEADPFTSSHEELTHMFWELGINDALGLVNAGDPVAYLAATVAAIAECLTIANNRWPGIQQIIVGPWNSITAFPSFEAQILQIIAAEQAAAAALPNENGLFVNWHLVPMVTSGPGQNTVDGVHPNSVPGVGQLAVPVVAAVV